MYRILLWLLKKADGIIFNFYEEINVLLVESASFVSLLIRKEIVKTIGSSLKRVGSL